MPARGPSATPATTAVTVTGCTFGTAANRTRPAAAAAASVAIRTSSLLEPGPVSSHAAPATISPTATSSSASAASSGEAAVHTAAASEVASASSPAALDKRRLPLGRRRDAAVGDIAREDEVVRHDERRAVARLRAQQGRELGLAHRVDAAGRLVENEQVRLRDEHGRQCEPLPLAA